MLHGVMGPNYNRTEVLLANLHASEFHFFLTGSRFFGNYTNTSDWDFFTEDTAKLRKYLKSLGFVGVPFLNESGNYHDYNTSVVYSGYNIHIQLQRDVIKKRKAQEIMFIFFPLWKETDKNKRYLWWNEVYKVLDKISDIMIRNR